MLAKRLARKFICHIGENKRFYSVLGFTLITSLTPVPAFATDVLPGGNKLISFGQNLDKIIGIIGSLWAVAEWQLGYPGWKKRLAAGIIGYVLCLVIPHLFNTIEAAIGR